MGFDNCISTFGGQSAGLGVFQITFQNNCNECVEFQPIAEGQGGSPDLPMSNFVGLGQPVSSVQLQPGGQTTMYYGPGPGGQAGQWQATARNPRAC